MTFETNPEQKLAALRPEPIFKLLTRLEAAQFGIQAIETELQYTTRADLGMTLPVNVSVAGTIF